MKVLIVGATGMLGYSLFTNLSDADQLNVYGTVRNIKGKEQYYTGCEERLFTNVDVSNLGSIEAVIQSLQPEVVINCIGLIKQHDISKQHIDAVSINSLLPHQLASICSVYSSKLIHFSTDCVFNGNKGQYTESDLPDAIDLYGRSKCLGEVDYAPHLTIRTSIIGHELDSNVSLVDWFLSQDSSVKGFTRAIFSGVPTVYVAKLLLEKILFNKELTGLYHLSADPIDKHSLLELINKEYNKDIYIEEEKHFVIDRSLCSKRIKEHAKIHVPDWPTLIAFMHNDFDLKYKGKAHV
jgi:dTDP-4-dehydrorhamnose reductase